MLHSSRLDREQDAAVEQLTSGIRRPRLGPMAAVSSTGSESLGLPSAPDHPSQRSLGGAPHSVPGERSAAEEQLPAVGSSSQLTVPCGKAQGESVAEGGERVQGGDVSAEVQRQNLGGTSGQCTGASGRAELQAIVFDCDGVLVDSERLSCEALRLALLEVGFV